MTEAIQAKAKTDFPPANRPTMYFIGVTTGQSSIMRVFPQWAKYLGLGDVRLQGIDCEMRADPAIYRRIVSFLKNDLQSKGALVTTHKLDLLKACRDLFTTLDPYAQLMDEVSAISKDGDRLVGHAKDLITSGLALESFLPRNYWSSTKAEALILGAGGASIAISSYLMSDHHGSNRPSRIVIADRSPERLSEIARIHAQLGRPVPTQYFPVAAASDNDALLAGIRPGSLVVNATGLGKDAPGSPLTDAARFPKGGFAWEFNYRGELVFLEQARAAGASRQLHVEDGWTYFLHGWTRVIAEVFHIDIPSAGPRFEDLSRIAKEMR